jgi:hypothetical protein
MLRWPRWDDRGWWRSQWHEARPRLLTFDLRVTGFRLRWAFPAWALEESLRASALLALWVGYAVGKFAPNAVRSVSRRPIRLAQWLPRAPWGAFVPMLEGAGDGMLALPGHAPLVEVSVGESVHIRICTM